MCQDISKLFFLLAGIFFVVGVFVLALSRIPGFGRLPGDILIKKEDVTFYFPVMTSLLVSLGLSILLYFFHKR